MTQCFGRVPKRFVTGMFEAEAIWLGKLLDTESGENLSPLLNIGSSTRQFRQVEQPWTEQFIFAPLKARGIDVLHLDSRDGDGIDIRADVLSAHELPRIRALGPKSILCCNILEHVSDPAVLARRCMRNRWPRRADFCHRPIQLPVPSRPHRYDVPAFPGRIGAPVQASPNAEGRGDRHRAILVGRHPKKTVDFAAAFPAPALPFRRFPGLATIHAQTVLAAPPVSRNRGPVPDACRSGRCR